MEKLRKKALAHNLVIASIIGALAAVALRGYFTIVEMSLMFIASTMMGWAILIAVDPVLDMIREREEKEAVRREARRQFRVYNLKEERK